LFHIEGIEGYKPDLYQYQLNIGSKGLILQENYNS